MLSFRLALLAATALATSTAPALAQSAQGPAPAQTQPGQSQTPSPQAPAQSQQPAEDPADEAPAEAQVEEVNVTGRRSDVRTSIDSISYSLANDLQAASGSLADALRNVPSVDVDPQGNVSLRGDGNVTILVDGRPSGVLQGEGRGQAILSLPADQYARIEVMTNPSAAYSPEGSGGVINLITKPTAPRQGQTYSGSVRLNVGDSEKWNAGVSGSWQSGRLTLSGDLNARHDSIVQEIDTRRERLDPATGAVLSVTTTDRVIDPAISDGVFGRFTAEYRLDDRTQLTGELRANAFENYGEGLELFETFDAAGARTGAFQREGRGEFQNEGLGFTGRLLRRFDDQGHEWSNELRIDRGANDNLFRTIVTPSLPAGPSSFESSATETDFTILAFTSAYVRPSADGSRLRLGYELDSRQPEVGNTLRRGPSEGAAAVVPGLTNRFEAEQTVHAVYGTYEKPLTEKLSGQIGLRLEQADIEINQITTATRAAQDYFKAYPTMHLQYQLTETQLLRASYSRRIQRPQPFQLNPFVSYQDPLNQRSGNPDLEPQETDAFEALWQVRAGQSFYQATLYYRDTSGAFTDVARDIGGGVLLTRPENLGARRDVGVELVANGRLHSTLRYNAAVNVFRQEIDAAGIPGAQDREGDLVSGRLTLNWQPTANDFLQVSGFWQGEQLLAQGTRESSGMVNLGYRRTLNPKWAFQFTARDVFDTFENTVNFDTPAFRDRQNVKIGLRGFFVGLTYSFGAAPRQPRDPQFDFSGPQTGG